MTGQELVSYLTSHWVEITGTILSLIYLFLSVKQHIWLWIFGFASSALYIAVFFRSKFYADMSLQVYYLAVSVYGFLHWTLKRPETGKGDLPVVSVNGKQIVILSLAAVVIWAAYYFVLSNFTDSDVAFPDSVTTALSIVATWMLARKMLEHWLIWIFVDAFSAFLYLHKELYFTTGLFAIYTLMAVIGYLRWRKDAHTPAVR